jgi:hypothetical protein
VDITVIAKTATISNIYFDGWIFTLHIQDCLELIVLSEVQLQSSRRWARFNKFERGNKICIAEWQNALRN